MTRNYKDISYTLKRSKRKTASIYVERDGEVSVLVPKELTKKQVEALQKELDGVRKAGSRTTPRRGNSGLC